jgi:hypothetical protein
MPGEGGKEQGVAIHLSGESLERMLRTLFRVVRERESLG